MEYIIQNKLCKEADFQTVWYTEYCKVLKEIPRLHRKQWEFVAICQALDEREKLTNGSYGLGFAVGQEPLPSYFASRGCKIVATDLQLEKGKQMGWADTNQLCFGKDDLNSRQICDKDIFNQNVIYEELDMNEIPEKYRKGEFDFSWSSCSFEHLGSIQKGLDFFINQMDCLKKGGIAVHTTEFNISSNTDTLDDNATVLFRKKDIDLLGDHLKSKGYKFQSVDYSVGNMVHDWFVDEPPYRAEPHLRLLLSNYVTTSIILIVEK
jgi:hypothetical protein